MKYLKEFENHAQYEAFTATTDFIKPNVSHCIQENEVHYNPWVETRLMVTYNIEDASEPTQLYYYYAEEGDEEYWIRGIDMFDKVEIDGTEVSVSSLDTNWGGYQLSVGEHTIAYTLKDPTTIANNAFYGCSGLTNVTIPDSVTSIGNRAFQICSGLTSITIPNSVTSIGDAAFDGCENLTSVEIDSNTIVSATYTYMNNLKNIFGTQVTEYIIGNSVTSIGSNAFDDCENLTSVTIPSGVTSIGSNAFEYCGSLTSVTIGSGVTSIGDSAFNNCSSLSGITVDSNNTTYDSRNNCNAIVETSTNTLLVGCKNTVIPNTITAIGDYAFSHCSGLTSVTIPDSVTSIGKYAFGWCNSLTSVTIPDSVTSISGNAFFNCSSLTNIIIPSSVTSIGDYAFRNCTSLTSVTSNATTAPTIASNTFRSVKTGGTLTVPSGSSGYNTWMQNANYYLGLYNWTKVEQ